MANLKLICLTIEYDVLLTKASLLSLSPGMLSSKTWIDMSKWIDYQKEGGQSTVVFVSISAVTRDAFLLSQIYFLL